MYVEPNNKSCSFTYILSMTYLGIHFALTQLYALKSSLYLVIRKRRRNQLNKLPTIIENIYPGNRIFQIHSLPRMDRKRQFNLNRRNLILEICFPNLCSCSWRHQKGRENIIGVGSGELWISDSRLSGNEASE